MFRFNAWFLVLCVLPCGAFAAPPPVPAERITEYVQQEMSRQKVPGIAVAVVQGGETRQRHFVSKAHNIEFVDCAVFAGTH